MENNETFSFIRDRGRARYSRRSGSRTDQPAHSLFYKERLMSGSSALVKTTRHAHKKNRCPTDIALTSDFRPKSDWQPRRHFVSLSREVRKKKSSEATLSDTFYITNNKRDRFGDEETISHNRSVTSNVSNA